MELLNNARDLLSADMKGCLYSLAKVKKIRQRQICSVRFYLQMYALDEFHRHTTELKKSDTKSTYHLITFI